MLVSIPRLRGNSRAENLKSSSKGLSSIFLKRGRRVEFVKLGCLFKRTRRDRSVETARVLGMLKDNYGIMHVRYEVNVSRRHMSTSYFEGPRTLALAAFADTYRDRHVED